MRTSIQKIPSRVLVTAGILLGGTLLLHALTHGERRLPQEPLEQLPLQLGSWQGRELPLSESMVQAAGVDDYVNRIYGQSSQNAIGLYVGFYASQRSGDTIHSPKNCLPGSGWEPLRAGQLTLVLPNHSAITVNEYVIAKGLDKELVLYWYQGRGRVVASEYWGKAWMIIDAIKRNRTDGALVRVVTTTEDGDSQAEARLVKFVGELYPQLDKFIPN